MEEIDKVQGYKIFGIPNVLSLTVYKNFNT